MSIWPSSNYAALLLSVLLLGGCTAAVSPTPAPEAEERELRHRVLELQRKAAIAEVELARLREQVARLELAAQGESSAGPSRRLEDHREPIGALPSQPQAPAMQRPDPVAPERRTPGLDPDAAAAFDLAIESSDLEPLPAPVTEPPPEVVTEVQEFSQPPPAAEPVAGTRARRAPVSEDAQALYDQGYTLFHQSLYLDAETVFQQFLQRHAGTELGDNALFWIGESRAARGDHQGALAAYREAIEGYPTGNKVPDAMLRVGESLGALGDLEGARMTYDELVEQFPFSAAATTALEHLAGR